MVHQIPLLDHENEMDSSFDSLGDIESNNNNNDIVMAVQTALPIVTEGEVQRDVTTSRENKNNNSSTAMKRSHTNRDDISIHKLVIPTLVFGYLLGLFAPLFISYDTVLLENFVLKNNRFNGSGSDGNVAEGSSDNGPALLSTNPLWFFAVTSAMIYLQYLIIRYRTNQIIRIVFYDGDSSNSNNSCSSNNNKNKCNNFDDVIAKLKCKIEFRWYLCTFIGMISSLFFISYCFPYLPKPPTTTADHQLIATDNDGNIDEHKKMMIHNKANIIILVASAIFSCLIFTFVYIVYLTSTCCGTRRRSCCTELFGKAIKLGGSHGDSYYEREYFVTDKKNDGYCEITTSPNDRESHQLHHHHHRTVYKRNLFGKDEVVAVYTVPADDQMMTPPTSPTTTTTTSSSLSPRKRRSESSPYQSSPQNHSDGYYLSSSPPSSPSSVSVSSSRTTNLYYGDGSNISSKNHNSKRSSKYNTVFWACFWITLEIIGTFIGGANVMSLGGTGDCTTIDVKHTKVATAATINSSSGSSTARAQSATATVQSIWDSTPPPTFRSPTSSPTIGPTSFPTTTGIIEDTVKQEEEGNFSPPAIKQDMEYLQKLLEDQHSLQDEDKKYLQHVREQYSLPQLKQQSSTSSSLKVAWLMSYPNSGTSYTMKLVRLVSNRTTASNYGDEHLYDGGNNLLIGDEYGNGPFRNYEKMELPTSGHILTKTHCGGRCVHCGPDKYIETPRSFMNDCLQTKKYVNHVGKVSQYQPSDVTKAIHLIRNPYDNVVSRFHLDYKKRVDANPRYAKRYKKDNDVDNFQLWCDDMNSAFARKEKSEGHLLDKKVLKLFKYVPCHGEFYRWVQWHNLAIQTTQYSMVSDINADGVDTKYLYYEDFVDSKFNSTLDGLLSFLNMNETISRTKITEQNPSLKFVPRTYHVDNDGDSIKASSAKVSSYYNRQQMDAIRKLVKELATPQTWKLIQHYFEKTSSKKSQEEAKAKTTVTELKPSTKEESSKSKNEDVYGSLGDDDEEAIVDDDNYRSNVVSTRTPTTSDEEPVETNANVIETAVSEISPDTNSDAKIPSLSIKLLSSEEKKDDIHKRD